MATHPFDLLMNPSSIAIIGAGNNPMKMGTMHALSILKDGYVGRLFPVHPTESVVLGQKAYKDVGGIPETPDLAILVVPAAAILNLLDDLGRAGTRRVIIISAGFRETGEEGKVNEEKLKETARRHGIRFLGPNCMGFINTDISLNTTVMTLGMKKGPLGLVSQSGTYVTQTLPYLAKHGIRFSKAVSVGNSTDLNLIDALEYMGDDESTRAIALYIEGISEVRRFLDVAKKITPRKPVIAQYVGGSAAGARAGLSHTGALAAPDHLYEGLFRQAGIIRVHSVEDLFGHGWMLATQPRLKGNRVAVITNSGGPGSSMAHTCEENGFDVVEFSEGLRHKLLPLVPPHAPCGNPVDITFSMDVEVLSKSLPDIVMSSGEVDAVVLHGPMKSGFMKSKYPHLKELLNDTPIESILEMFKIDLSSSASLPGKYGMPMAVSSFFDRDDDFTVAYHDHDVPVYDSPEKAAKALSALLRYREVQGKMSETDDDAAVTVSEEAVEILRRAREGGHGVLDEFESKKILKAYGIPVCREVLVHRESEIEEAVSSLGFPLVLKACSPDLPHKTGKGLIYLKQKTLEECVASFRKIQLSAGKKVPVLVSAMIEGDREFMTGFLRHEFFGGIVVFGMGGVFAEAFRDTAFRLAPLTMREASRIIRDIRMAPLLGEVRGLGAVNEAALAGLVRKISAVGTLHPEIAEMDLNPIIIEGTNPVVVDALVVLDGGTKRMKN